jgi:hypothetical protein
MVISLNGERKNIPSCFEEITTKQYERIISEWGIDKPLVERDFFKLFQIFTDTNFTDFHATAENEVTIWNAVRWFVESDFKFSEELPKVLKINECTVTIPKRIQALSIGQNIHLKQLLTKSKYLEEQLSAACAIYLQPLYDGKKFDYDRAMELKAVIEQMPAYLIRPIGFFLLKSALPHGATTQSKWQRMKNNLTERKERILLTWQGFTNSISLRT